MNNPTTMITNHSNLNPLLEAAKATGKNFVAYDATTEATRARRDHSNCAIRAISVALDLEFDSVRDHFANAGRDPRKWGEGTSKVQIDKFLRRPGVEVVFAAGGFKVQMPGISLRFALETFNSGRFIFSMRKHLVAAIDGIVVDLEGLDINRRYRTINFSTGEPIVSARIDHKVWKVWKVG